MALETPSVREATGYPSDLSVKTDRSQTWKMYCKLSDFAAIRDCSNEVTHISIENTVMVGMPL